jgi:RNA-dependent RNA polymerase
MCANGIPEHLFVDIFKQSVNKIIGLSGRVQNGTTTPEDFQLFSTTEVSCPCCVLELTLQFPLVKVIKAGYNKNPMILDMVDIIECRALQDLKWKARLQISGGVFMIGKSLFGHSGLLTDGQVWPTRLGH